MGRDQLRCLVGLLLCLIGTPFQASLLQASPLQVNLDQELTCLPATQFSIKVIRLHDGKTLYNHHGDRPLNPASNMKLVTEAAALHFLGPEFRFKTNFFAVAPSPGVVRDLWIKGYGDPLFITEELPKVVAGLKRAGIRRIEGNLYYDDSYFDEKAVVSYQSNSRNREYRIVTAPLTFNFSTQEIEAHPGPRVSGTRVGSPPVITLIPPNRYLTVVNQARTGGRRFSIRAREEKGRLVVSGSISPHSRGGVIRKEVQNPPLHTLQVIATALQEGGIEVMGSLGGRQAVPIDAQLLYTHESPPMREVLKALGKFSNNFAAEQLLKTLGAVQISPPGSTEKGLAVLQNYLEGLKLHGYTLENGSGLAKHSRLSADHLIALLQDMYFSPLREDFISSLSISGIDGTIRRRFKKTALRGEIVAKTGSLNGVVALSGYWLSAPGGPIAFAMLMNGSDLSYAKGAMLEEKILTSLADHLETR